ncbi:methylenetetrahydrofolate reductase [NAD(P)H] [uncultured Thomasclavelia sp.]|uniref:methylenetetrahydrofolate reductase [NAD(P)H] n=1 Tax=uncultured Thomasclavelia sp. TaxID=3025759 RepID=UPI0025F95BD9|nr:methylenetetrahydrofolate reductase [NAD(P)H] [uncultured Thomasclavelia sp.]
MKIIDKLMKKPTLSFEIFPPKKNDGDISSIYATIDELAKLKPDFISVTYGAGGSTTRNTVEIVSKIKRDYDVEPVAHLSCIDATPEQLTQVLNQLKENKIENILALRGDYPKDYDPQTAPHCFKYASELNEFITKNYPDTFCLSGACYPEVHQEAPSLEADLDALKKKIDSGAQYLITQLFYDNNYYYRLVREARLRGINVPIIAGIMPATNSRSLLNTAKLSGSNIPYTLSASLERFRNNPKAMREVGLNYATNQIIDLITNGVDGIHLYTMNRPEIVKEILLRTENIFKEFIDD